MNGEIRITTGSIASQVRHQQLSQYPSAAKPVRFASKVATDVATADVIAAWIIP
jgi:hypothetical protein